MASVASRSVLPSFGVQVTLGLAAGLVLGLVAREMGGETNWLIELFGTVGTVFVQLLKAIVPALVFTAIVASIANLATLQNGARLAAKTLLWFAITAGIAVAIGLPIGLLLEPGSHAGVAATAAAPPSSVGGWTDFLKGLVPANLFGLTGSTTIAADGKASSSASTSSRSSSCRSPSGSRR